MYGVQVEPLRFLPAWLPGPEGEPNNPRKANRAVARPCADPPANGYCLAYCAPAAGAAGAAGAPAGGGAP